MTQRAIPAVFLRGGTSKGLFFHARDLPPDRAAMEPLLLAALGSPDPNGRQLDGMGGGLSSLSKAVVIGPPTHPEADVDYLFAQVSVDRPVVDWGGNCGNLSAAVGPFAVDEGLVAAPPDGEAMVRIHQVNTRRLIHARFPVRSGKAEVRGDFALDGVAGTGARVRLDFLRPGGAATGRLLPAGGVATELEGVPASLVDAANPAIFVPAAALGLRGTEAPDALEADTALMARLEALRRLGAVRMGLAARPEEAALSQPKIALVAPPAPFRTLEGAEHGAGGHEVAVRMLSMGRVHRAVPLTGALALAVACRLPGSVPHGLAAPPREAGVIRVAHPSGTLAVGAEVAGGEALSAVAYRTARRLMQGAVLVP